MHNEETICYKAYPLATLALLQKGDSVLVGGHKGKVRGRLIRLDNEQYPLLIEASLTCTLENTEGWLTEEPAGK